MPVSCCTARDTLGVIICIRSYPGRFPYKQVYICRQNYLFVIHEDIFKTEQKWKILVFISINSIIHLILIFDIWSSFTGADEQLGLLNYWPDFLTGNPFINIALGLTVYRKSCVTKQCVGIILSSPDLNLTPLAALLRLCRAQRGSDRSVFEIRGWTATREMDHIEARWWKIMHWR